MRLFLEYPKQVFEPMAKIIFLTPNYLFIFDLFNG